MSAFPNTVKGEKWLNHAQTQHTQTNGVWGAGSWPRKSQHILRCVWANAHKAINISANCPLLTGQPPAYLGYPGCVTTEGQLSHTMDQEITEPLHQTL